MTTTPKPSKALATLIDAAVAYAAARKAWLDASAPFKGQAAPTETAQHAAWHVEGGEREATIARAVEYAKRLTAGGAVDDGTLLSRAVLALAEDRAEGRARVAELEAELADLYARHRATLSAFYEAAPGAAHALSKEQVNALSLDVRHGPEEAEQMRTALRKEAT